MTFLLRTLVVCGLMLLSQVDYAQDFTDCTGQQLFFIFGASTTTAQNLTGFPVNIEVTATGGDGGDETGCGCTYGGSGATMVGRFVLGANETIRAISGGKGTTAASGGGGAGSGVVNCGDPNDCDNGTILIIAAGGGGANAGASNGLGGSASTNGDGNGGLHNGNAGGGGGVNSNGGPYPTGNYGGIVLKTGVSGGVGNGGRGMGSGGGGLAGGGGGGGGGHTGGRANTNSPAASSFNSGTSQNNTNGTTGGGTGNLGSVQVICLSIALPVELVDFKAALLEDEVVLQWRTVSELNNQGYYVQRSADARNWKDLGFQAGAGTTVETQQYMFHDENPLPSLNYYRLRQTDFDGRSEYSPIVIADAGFATKSLTLFPNPAPEGITSMYFPEAPEAEGVLEVFDWLGNKVYRKDIALEGGSDVVVPVDLHSFPTGMYTVVLGIEDKVFSEKLLLKQK